MVYTERLDEIGRTLALAIRARRDAGEDDELRGLYGRLGAERLMRAADRNGILALAGAGLAGVDGIALAPEWREVLARNEARVRRLVDVLARVVARLERAGCASAAIEAGGVFLDSDLPWAGYSPGDIDLMYADGRRDDVLAAYAAEGFRPADKRERPTYRTEFRREEADGSVAWLEAGSRPFDRMWTPLPVEDRSQEWLGRRRPARKCAGIPVLEPSDALVHVSLHTSLHSFIRAPGLRLHVDVDRLVTDQAIDWSRTLSEVDRTRIRRRAFVSLACAAGLLGTRVPEEVLARLAPPSATWRAIARLLASDGVVADGGRKLFGPKAVLLDYLLAEEGAWRWAWQHAVPSTPWLRDHFDRAGEDVAPLRLHARRFRALVMRWRPR
jgi:hypothetical protein